MHIPRNNPTSLIHLKPPPHLYRYRGVSLLATLFSSTSNMNTKREKQSKAMQCIGAPLRVLGKAGDYYMRGMMGCSGNVGYGALVGCPNLQVSHLPKSACAVSRGGDKDLRELMGRVGRRSGGKRVETDGSHGVGIRRRSCNAGLGRIDEEKPCQPVKDDEGKLKAGVLYPRSRSCAVTRRNAVFY